MPLAIQNLINSKISAFQIETYNLTKNYLEIWKTAWQIGNWIIKGVITKKLGELRIVCLLCLWRKEELMTKQEIKDITRCKRNHLDFLDQNRGRNSYLKTHGGLCMYCQKLFPVSKEVHCSVMMRSFGKSMILFWWYFQ